MKFKISWAVAANIVITFLLLLLGGVVHNTESSLACPDWPLCYGQFFPKMEGSILIEHGHRLLASTVGFITVIILTLCFKFKMPGRFKILAGVSVFLVILQGILGGITVIYKLPTIVSTFHLGLSLIFFSSLIYLHHELKKFECREKRDEKIQLIPLGLSQFLIFITSSLYAQIVLGAFMRHSGAGAACGLDLKSALWCFDSSLWKNSWWPELITAQIHVLHRYFACILILLAGVLFFKMKKFVLKNPHPQLKFILNLIQFSTLLLVIQALLGIWTVASGIAILPTSLHLIIAAGALGSLVKANFILLDLTQLNTKEQHNLLSDFFNLTKPKLSSLVMATVFVGMVLAPGEGLFFKGLWSFILISMVVMGAGALNCFLEKDLDSQMERTKNRSLPSGRLSPSLALGFGLILVVASIGLLYVTVNSMTALLALLAAGLYVLAYTPLKKYTEHAVFVGAIPGAIPPILGWTAITGKVDVLSGIIYLIMLVWQIPHFFAISLFHSEDYNKAKIFTFPNVKGTKTTNYLILIFTIILVFSTLLPYLLGEAGRSFYLAALVLGFFFILLALRGLFHFKDPDHYRSWARQFFYASIIYLPILLLALIFFK